MKKILHITILCAAFLILLSCVCFAYDSVCTVNADGIHTPGESTVILPGCTNNGGVTVSCTACGEILSQDSVPATGHTLVYSRDITKATTDAHGRAVYMCTMCGEEFEGLSHLGEWNITKEPTTQETGRRIKECSLCGEIFKEQTLPKKSGIMYDANSDGKVTVKDALVIIKHINHWDDIVCYTEQADTDGDGTVGLIDLIQTLRYIAEQ